MQSDRITEAAQRLQSKFDDLIVQSLDDLASRIGRSIVADEKAVFVESDRQTETPRVDHFSLDDIKDESLLAEIAKRHGWSDSDIANAYFEAMSPPEPMSKSEATQEFARCTGLNPDAIASKTDAQIRSFFAYREPSVPQDTDSEVHIPIGDIAGYYVHPGEYDRCEIMNDFVMVYRKIQYRHHKIIDAAIDIARNNGHVPIGTGSIVPIGSSCYVAVPIVPKPKTHFSREQILNLVLCDLGRKQPGFLVECMDVAMGGWPGAHPIITLYQAQSSVPTCYSRSDITALLLTEAKGTKVLFGGDPETLYAEVS